MQLIICISWLIYHHLDLKVILPRECLLTESDYSLSERRRDQIRNGDPHLAGMAGPVLDGFDFDFADVRNGLG